MVARVYGDQIVLKLPVDRVTALLRTPGCSYFKPHDRVPMRQWLAFGTSSPAFSTLAELFEEAVSFAQTPSPNKKRVKAAPKIEVRLLLVASILGLALHTRTHRCAPGMSPVLGTTAGGTSRHRPMSVRCHVPGRAVGR
jgi:hypothetical protein